MGQIEKFLFNISFDEAEMAKAEAAARSAQEGAEEEEAEEEQAPTFSEEELEAARREGFEEGKAEGVREAGDAVETQISSALGQLAGQIGTLFQQQVSANAALFDDAIHIATSISKKCFPHLSETQSLQVIEDMVRDVLAAILEEPRALVHIHPDLVEPLNERIGAITDAANFEGQVIIIDDAAISLGDCRVSWSSGSAERDMDALWRSVDEIVEANIRAVTQPDARESVAADGAPTPPAPTPQPDGAPAPAADAAQPAAPADEPATPQPAPGEAPQQATEESELSPENNELDETGPAPATPGPDTAADDIPAPEGAPADADADETGAHLQAGPGIMAEPDEATILEPDAAAAEEPAAEAESADVDLETLEAEESRPPTGANR